MESQLKSEKRGTATASAVPYVVALLRENPELEVFEALGSSAESHRLAVRSRRTGRWYGVLVVSTSPGRDALLPDTGYRPAGDQLVAAVVVGSRGVPERAYFVRGSEWADESTMPLCLLRDHGGPGAGPHVGIRTSDPAQRAELDLWYGAERVLRTL